MWSDGRRIWSIIQFYYWNEDQRVFKSRENAIDLTLKLYINLAVHSLLLVRFPMDCLQLFPVCYSQAFSGLFVSRELESSRNIFFCYYSSGGNFHVQPQAVKVLQSTFCFLKSAVSCLMIFNFPHAFLSFSSFKQIILTHKLHLMAKSVIDIE